MRQAGVEPDVITWIALVSTCEKGEQWLQARQLLEDIRQAGAEPNVVALEGIRLSFSVEGRFAR